MASTTYKIASLNYLCTLAENNSNSELSKGIKNYYTENQINLCPTYANLTNEFYSSNFIISGTYAPDQLVMEKDISYSPTVTTTYHLGVCFNGQGNSIIGGQTSTEVSLEDYDMYFANIKSKQVGNVIIDKNICFCDNIHAYYVDNVFTTTSDITTYYSSMCSMQDNNIINCGSVASPSYPIIYNIMDLTEDLYASLNANGQLFYPGRLTNVNCNGYKSEKGIYGQASSTNMMAYIVAYKLTNSGMEI